MTDPLPPHRAFHERSRFSLIWLVPLVAIIAAGWLGYRAMAERGPLISITMQSAEGIEVGKTKIKHRDIELGTVEAMAPSEDLTSVRVEARMNRYAKSHLNKNTRFWVVRPRFSAEGVSGLNTLISGSYIEIEPGAGEPTRHFVALEDPPVISTDVPGTEYVLHSFHLGSISQGAPVSFHGIKVGQVLGYQLSDEDGSATVKIFVRAPHDRLVHQGTRFWNASGVAVELNSDGMKVQAESLQSILSGGVAFDVPQGGEAGQAADPSAEFTLYASEDRARDALYTRKIPFLIHLSGDAGGLSIGAPVRMRGIKIGEVTDVHLEYDDNNRQVSIPVIIEVEPQRVTLLHTNLAEINFKDRAYASFRAFVARGLRARVGAGNLLTGQKIISLDFVHDAPKRTMIDGGTYPEIPSVPSDDIDEILQSTKGLLADLRTTANSANQAISSDPETGGDLSGTLSELKRAAQSLRLLTESLEGHPEAIIRGKNAESAQ